MVVLKNRKRLKLSPSQGQRCLRPTIQMSVDGAVGGGRSVTSIFCPSSSFL
jgi:hypothetical protein